VEVEGNLYPDELDIGPTTVDKIAIDNWQKNCRVCGHCRVLDLVARVIVEAQYCQTAKITPAVLEKSEPIIPHTVNRSCQVELLTQCIKLYSEVSGRGCQGCLVDLVCVSAFFNRHARVYDWVEIDRSATNSNGHQCTWGERSAMRRW
jgi:hypothetical protein